MNEPKVLIRERKTKWIEDEPPYDFVRNKVKEDGRYKFYLRFVQTHHIPCDECQIKLHKMITESDHLFLGNQKYDPPIELSRYWEVIEDSWEEIERRPPTKADFKNLYGSGWQKFWDGWKEAKE